MHGTPYSKWGSPVRAEGVVSDATEPEDQALAVLGRLVFWSTIIICAASRKDRQQASQAPRSIVQSG